MDFSISLRASSDFVATGKAPKRRCGIVGMIVRADDFAKRELEGAAETASLWAASSMRGAGGCCAQACAAKSAGSAKRDRRSAKRFMNRLLLGNRMGPTPT